MKKLYSNSTKLNIFLCLLLICNLCFIIYLKANNFKKIAYLEEELSKCEEEKILLADSISKKNNVLKDFMRVDNSDSNTNNKAKSFSPTLKLPTNFDK